MIVIIFGENFTKAKKEVGDLNMVSPSYGWKIKWHFWIFELNGSVGWTQFVASSPKLIWHTTYDISTYLYYTNENQQHISNLSRCNKQDANTIFKKRRMCAKGGRGHYVLVEV